MHAVILAAGCGRRSGLTIPKSMLEIGGKTLLERHLDALDDIPATLVVGYEQAKVRALLGGRVTYVENPRFEHDGVIRSFAAGLEAVADGDLLFMDADVIYPPALLHRLLRSPYDLAFAVDRRSVPSSEEMMVTVYGGRVREISRRPRLPYDRMGETAGFTKVGARVVPSLRRAVASAIAGGAKGDYEIALDLLVKEEPADVVEIDDLPWTEIDFPEDVERARQLAADF